LGRVAEDVDAEAGPHLWGEENAGTNEEERPDEVADVTEGEPQ
jgi:hypothetical protein